MKRRFLLWLTMASTLIANGAEKNLHWSFLPIVDPVPPQVAAEEWVRSPIDRFILARLERAELKPMKQADRSTLIRRVTFDLTGLPPTPEEIETFMGDDAADAYSRLVERLLASPAYGERWGRHWLDVARYADCNGADESKSFPNAYHYRNYVIDTFNHDLPFDRFIQHQLAGDLLDPSDSDHGLEPLTGTGFLVLGTKILAEKDRPKMMADVIDEQIDTVGRAFVGLTLGCARCHDHKFDPISMQDYYAMAGIMHSTRTMAKPGQWLERTLQNKTHQAKQAEFDQQISALNARLKTMEDKIATALKNTPSAAEFEAETFVRGNVIVDRDQYGKGIGIVGDLTRGPDWVEWDIVTPVAGDYRVEFRYAAKISRPGKLRVNGVEVKHDSMGRTTGGWMPKHQRWFSEGVHSFVKGTNVLRYENKKVMSHLDKVRLYRADDELKGLIDRQAQMEAEKAALTERRAIVSKPIRVMSVEEGAIQNVKVHLRGSHLSLGDEVPRGLLKTIADGYDVPIPENQSGRLQLANWLTDPDHPLTARVIVNRVWRWHFGAGLVRTPDNFGFIGDVPSHPDLLDFLARAFMRDGWSLKRLHQRILASSTYRLSSGTDMRSERIDPENRLFWRFNRQRLNAESIRDSLLAISGQLDREMGGAPLTLKSYNSSPEDVEENQKFYETSRRRSVYLPVLRTQVYDFLSLFDFPNPDFSTGNRMTTILPTQALWMMNSPTMEQWASQTAERLLSAPNLQTNVQRLRHLYLACYSRIPEKGELLEAQAFLQAYLKSGEKVTNLEAWAALCQTCFSANEFVFLN